MVKKEKYKNTIFVPYRICPLGAHIDHQLGLVTGFALNKGITINFSKTNNGNFKAESEDFESPVSFNYKSLPKISGIWSDYLVATIKALKENYNLEYGMECYVKGDLPIGGLASSSAVIISYALAILKVNNLSIEEKDLINLVVKVENKYLFTKVGLLDPSAEIYSKKGSLLCFDPKNKKCLWIEPEKKVDFKICLIYSGVSRRLTNTIYNVRVDECKSTAFLMNSFYSNTPLEFKDCYLRNHSYDEFLSCKNNLPLNHVKRATHYYEEIDRVSRGMEYFRKGDIVNFGKEMFSSGTSSIKNYETGSDQLEKLHEIAESIDGIYGGRFSGAGFNGYYIAIIDPTKEKDIIAKISDEYLKCYPQYKDSFKIFVCDTSDGVKI